MLKLRSLNAILLQFSGIVGAGIFALPYVFYHTHPLVSFLLLIFALVLTLLINHFYIEIILNTSGDHQISGYASIYLNSKYKTLSLINFFLLGIGAFAAYLKLSGQFLTILFPSLSPILAVIIFLFVLSILHLLDVKFTKNLNSLIPLVAVYLTIFLFASSFSLRSPSTPILISSPLTTLRLDIFGVILFALSGFTVIPEVEELLRGTPNISSRLKFASIFGTLLAFLLYLLFIFSVINISSAATSPDSLLGVFASSPFLGRILAAFGVFITLNASLNYLLTFRELFFRDLYLSRNLSQNLSLLVPIFALVLSFLPLIKIISLTGSVTIFLFALIICLIRMELPHSKYYPYLAGFVVASLYLGMMFEFL